MEAIKIVVCNKLGDWIQEISGVADLVNYRELPKFGKSYNVLGEIKLYAGRYAERHPFYILEGYPKSVCFDSQQFVDLPQNQTP
jgi:hypothetical protein